MAGISQGTTLLPMKLDTPEYSNPSGSNFPPQIWGLGLAFILGLRVISYLGIFSFNFFEELSDLFFRMALSLSLILGYLWLKEDGSQPDDAVKQIRFFYAICFFVGIGILVFIYPWEHPRELAIGIENWVFYYYLGKIWLLLQGKYESKPIPKLELIFGLAAVIGIGAIGIMYVANSDFLVGIGLFLETPVSSLLSLILIACLYAYWIYAPVNALSFITWLLCTVMILAKGSIIDLGIFASLSIIFVNSYFGIPYWKMAIVSLVVLIPILLMAPEQLTAFYSMPMINDYAPVVILAVILCAFAAIILVSPGKFYARNFNSIFQSKSGKQLILLLLVPCSFFLVYWDTFDGLNIDLTMILAGLVSLSILNGIQMGQKEKTLSLKT